MKSVLRSCLLLCCHIVLVELALPLGWKKCAKTDPKRNKCLVDAINGALQTLWNGNEDLGVPNLNTVRFGQIHTIDESNGSISLDFVFKNYVVTNLKVIYISDVEINGTTIHLEARSPGVIEAVSPYSVTGTVLTKPVTGDGQGTFQFYKVYYTYEFIFHTDPQVRNGKKYLVCDKAYFRTFPDRMIFNLENLFDGDKERGDEMNKLINDNWELAWDDMKPHFNEKIAEGLDVLVNTIFQHLPADEIDLF